MAEIISINGKRVDTDAEINATAISLCEGVLTALKAGSFTAFAYVVVGDKGFEYAQSFLYPMEDALLLGGLALLADKVKDAIRDDAYSIENPT